MSGKHQKLAPTANSKPPRPIPIRRHRVPILTTPSEPSHWPSPTHLTNPYPKPPLYTKAANTYAPCYAEAQMYTPSRCRRLWARCRFRVVASRQHKDRKPAPILLSCVVVIASRHRHCLLSVAAIPALLPECESVTASGALEC
jgi:hypothetical protein